MEEYWNRRYIKGGISGAGSRGEQRTWRWNLIHEYIPVIEEVIDVGCGDLAFWEGKSCKDYTGIDISEIIIEKNKTKRPDWKFIKISVDEHIESLKKECVFCLGVLFHIMNEEVFIKTLNNLCKYSKKHIVIYTWITNPFNRWNTFKRIISKILQLKIMGIIKDIRYIIKSSQTDSAYQYYRPLERYLHIFINNNFKLVEKRSTPDSIGGFYFFRKVE